jgi:hypothetical protein
MSIPNAAARLFTPVDRSALQRAQDRMRPWLVTVTVAGEYESLAAVAEVSSPAADDVRWVIYRDAEGVLMDDLQSNSAGRYSTVDDAVARVVSTIQAAVTAIPATIQTR